MRNSNCGIFCCICFILTVIGGLNWGLVGIFDFNLVASLFGKWPILERIIYTIVGIASLILIFLASRCCGKRGTCDHRHTHTHVPPSNHHNTTPHV